MPIAKITSILLALLMLTATDYARVRVHITTADAIDLARKIAHDEGYDVNKTTVYSFDLLTAADGKPFQPGYTSVGFDINGNPRNLILINDSTGQAIDYNSCEIFDYPNLRSFQKRLMRLSNSRRKTPSELAKDIGCDAPKVLSKPLINESDKSPQ